MNKEETIKHENNVIENITLLTAVYKPITKNDYVKFYFKLKCIDYLTNILIFVCTISIAIGFILFMSELVIRVFNFDVFIIDIKYAIYIVLFGGVFGFLAKTVYGLLTKILETCNLIRLEKASDFTEISRPQYNNIESLINKNLAFKGKIQDVMIFREGKVFEFDYKQLYVDELFSAYKRLDKANMPNEDLLDVKKRIIHSFDE